MRKLLLGLIIPVALTVTACSSYSTEEVNEGSPNIETLSSKETAASPTVSPSLDVATEAPLKPLHCMGFIGDDGNTVHGIDFVDFDEAWAYAGEIRITACALADGYRIDDFVSSEQEAELESIGIDYEDAVEEMYTDCGAPYLSLADSEWERSNVKDWEVENAEQFLAGTKILCPDYPWAKEMQDYIAGAQEVVSSRGIDDGTYIVGENIQSGTYVIEQATSGCYWERLDSAGQIIDNNFISGSTRVEVTIRGTDYSFNSSGCGGGWIKQ